MKHLIAASLIVAVAIPAPAQDAPKPPVAARKPYKVTSPNGTREDDYYWLRDDTRKNPEMLAALNAENAYADAMLAPTKALQDTLYKEVVGRIKQDDTSVPYKERGYYYYSRFDTGADYPITARRKGTVSAVLAVVLAICPFMAPVDAAPSPPFRPLPRTSAPPYSTTERPRTRPGTTAR